jgi:hypothetical protein
MIVQTAEIATDSTRSKVPRIQRPNSVTVMCCRSHVTSGNEAKIRKTSRNETISSLPLIGKLMKARPATSTVMTIIMANMTTETSAVSAPRNQRVTALLGAAPSSCIRSVTSIRHYRAICFT